MKRSDPGYMKAYYAANKEKCKEIQKRYYEKNRDKLLKRTNEKMRQLRTGCTPEMVSAFLQIQDGKCAICSKDLVGRDACADHCHKIGKVRGLLCRKCNSGIGQLGDDPARVQLAADYLRRHQESN